MKKPLKYISIPAVAAIIAVISVAIPYAYAQDTGPVQGQISVEQGYGGCFWSGTPWASDLTVYDDTICIITGTGRTANSVWVQHDANASGQAGGKLIVGGTDTNTGFTVNGAFSADGIVEIGAAGSPAYNSQLVVAGNLSVSGTGSNGDVDIVANTNVTNGSNSIDVNDTLYLYGNGTLTNNDNAQSTIAYGTIRGTLENLHASGTIYFDNIYGNTIYLEESGSLNNDGILKSDNPLSVEGSFSVDNSGEITVNDNNLTIMNTGAATFINSGDINISGTGFFGTGGTLIVAFSCTFNNTGTVTTTDFMVAYGGIFNNNAGGSVITQASGLDSPGRFMAFGYTAWGGHGTFNNNTATSTVTAPVTWLVAMDPSTGPGYTDAPTINNNSGAEFNTGAMTFSFEDGGVTYFGDQTYGGIFNNTGTLTVSGSGNSVEVYVGGKLNNLSGGIIDITSGNIKMGTTDDDMNPKGDCETGTAQTCKITNASTTGIALTVDGTVTMDSYTNITNTGNLTIKTSATMNSNSVVDNSGSFTVDDGGAGQAVISFIELASGSTAAFNNAAGGTVTIDDNAGGAADGEVRIKGSSVYTNNGTTNCNILQVFRGTLTNTGTTGYFLTKSTGGTGLFSPAVYVYEGTINNSSTCAPATCPNGSFYTASWTTILGTSGYPGTINNSGTAYSATTNVIDYGTLNLTGSRWISSLDIRGTSDTPIEGKVNISSGAVLGRSFSVGTDPSRPHGSLINNGTIRYTEVDGSQPSTAINVFLNYNGSFTNKNLAVLNTNTGSVFAEGSSVLTNETGGSVTTTNLTGNGTGVAVSTNGAFTISNLLYIYNGAEMSYTSGGSPYSAGTVEIQSANSNSEASKITVANGTTLNITGTHTGCAGTNICSLEVGYDNPGGTPGTSELIINGTVNISETANNGRVEVSHLGRGGIMLADNAVLNVDETGSVFYIRGDTSENATADIDGTMDIEMPLYVSGTLTVDTTDSTNATVNMVSNYTVTSTGKVNQGLLSTVTVEGSTTSISGDYGLDGTLDTGTGDGDSLTVTGTGHIFSRNSLSTNFKILAHDLTINSGGKIASDNKSEVNPGSQGSGSYGGAGEGRAATTSYGKTKLDINDAPLYGQAGASDSFGSIDAYGGGGVRIYSTGTITHSGEISADGMASSNSGGGAGAGGTVILIHEPLSKDDDFTGSGVITANGGGSSTTGVPVGGGGRIVIDSILYDDPDAGSYGFDGTVSALPGANSTDADYAAAGTIVYTGDGHNSNDTLIVNQNNTLATSSEITSIPNTGTPAEFSFARVEARNGAKITYEADPVTDPVSCFEVGTGSDVNEGGFFTCNPYPDKPDTLYINDSWEGAQAGDGDEPANGAAITGLYDLTPVFSVVYRNPEDTAEVDKVKIQVDDSSNFASPLWDTTFDLGTDSVAPGERTKDIEYAGTALSANTTYYVRMAFFDSTDAHQGLWTHRDIGDANGDYHYNFDIDASMIINETCTGAFVIKDTTGGGNIRNVPGDRYGKDTCTIDVTSTYGYWSVLFGKQPGETAFEDSTVPTPNNINPINNAGADCTMATNGSGTQEEYGYNIDTTLSAAVIQNHVETDGECTQDYDNSSYMFDVEDEGGEDEIIRVNDNNTIDDSFVLTMHASVNVDTAAVTGYSLGVRAIITTPP